MIELYLLIRLVKKAINVFGLKKLVQNNPF